MIVQMCFELGHCCSSEQQGGGSGSSGGGPCLHGRAARLTQRMPLVQIREGSTAEARPGLRGVAAPEPP